MALLFYFSPNYAGLLFVPNYQLYLYSYNFGWCFLWHIHATYHKNRKAPHYCEASVPRTGFEPAHPCERCDLNTVRLPISPPGHFPDSYRDQGCKYKTEGVITMLFFN
jgi:hypothetical protein